MNLDDAQKQRITQWINEGLKLAEIQKRLASEFGLNLTYMQVRLLVDDLKLVPKDPEPAKPADLPPPSAPQPSPSEAAKAPGSPGRLSVTVDQLTRPGALASGSVTFRDGKQATWYLDQMGRLGLVPKDQGYKPSAADIQEFQMALENEFNRMGM